MRVSVVAALGPRLRVARDHDGPAFVTGASRIAVIALSTLCALTAACGGGGSGVAAKAVPAGQWAAAVCRSIERYDRATAHPYVVFQGLHLEFKYGFPKQSAVRDKQIAASQSIVRATDELVVELKAAGTPMTPHGSAFANELVSATHELRDSVDHVHDQATSLPTGSGRAAADAELSPQIGAALMQLGHRLAHNRAANGAGISLRCGGS